MSLHITLTEFLYSLCNYWLLRDWKGPRGRPRATWLRGIDADVQSANIGIHSAWRKVKDNVLWRRIIDTATLHKGDATEELL